MKFILKKVGEDSYLSCAKGFDKKQFQDNNVKFAFHPYDYYNVCRFSTKVEAEAALDNYFIHHSKNIDVALIEVI